MKIEPKYKTGDILYYRAFNNVWKCRIKSSFIDDGFVWYNVEDSNIVLPEERKGINKMDSFIVREDILYTTIELLKEGKL